MEEQNSLELSDFTDLRVTILLNLDSYNFQIFRTFYYVL